MLSPLVFSGVGLTDPPHVSLTTTKIYVKNDEISGKKRNGFCFAQDREQEEEETPDSSARESSESSSIGVDDSSYSSTTVKDEGEEEEVQSKRKNGAFSSLESMEESLPIKRGLSNFFSGKSKSFASLSDVANAAVSATDIAKAENPFNKRRRILMASKARRASYSSLVSTYLPPLLSPDNTVLEEGDEEEEEKKVERPAGAATAVPLDSFPVQSEGMKKAFRSPRCFSLSDLQHA